MYYLVSKQYLTPPYYIYSETKMSLVRYHDITKMVLEFIKSYCTIHPKDNTGGFKYYLIDGVVYVTEEHLDTYKDLQNSITSTSTISGVVTLKVDTIEQLMNLHTLYSELFI